MICMRRFVSPIEIDFLSKTMWFWGWEFTNYKYLTTFFKYYCSKVSRDILSLSKILGELVI